MEYAKNVLETIGNTPLIQLNKVIDNIPALVLAKVEPFNPGHSIKDRMAVKMVEDAEKEGKLKPGGTIIECTSGNTGMGLALAACVKGYKCIFTASDKQSREKFDMLKALGAEVIVCPTDVAPDDPRSYYSVAERLSEEIPNSYWFNQYDNLSNTQAHYESTGPEIWRQTDEKITHLIVGVGTGGTISGTGRFLKEQNEDIQVIGVDAYGSVFKKYHETGEFDEDEIYPYITEGIGEDLIPKNVDFDIIDHFEKVTDKDGALAARRLARDEGLLMGYSAGSAVAAINQLRDRFDEDDVVVVIFHDHGSRYTGKIYNDEWMMDHGFLERELKLQDILDRKQTDRFITVGEDATLEDVLKLLREEDISQLPVFKGEEMTGSISECSIMNHLLNHPKDKSVRVRDIMEDPFPVVSSELPCKRLSEYLSREVPAVIVKDRINESHILTQYDLIHAL